jgi:DtxR family manganese transport transcriptional regulator
MSGRKGKAKPTARVHGRVRREHSAEAAEDYCEAIDDLVAGEGQARVMDLARRFGLSHVTVSRVLARLRREGLLRSGPGEPLALTPRGRTLAHAARSRHRAVVEFLLALGVPKEVAEADAEGIEHHVSPETLEAFAAVTAARSPRRP